MGAVDFHVVLDNPYAHALLIFLGGAVVATLVHRLAAPLLLSLVQPHQQ